MTHQSDAFPRFEDRSQHNVDLTLYAMRAHTPFLYGLFAEIFSKAQPYFGGTPTRECKTGICKLLAAREYRNTYDLHDERATAARRLHDCVQEAIFADRQLVLSELMREGYGLGAASHTAQIVTTAEAVGATAGAAFSWNSKASHLLNMETGNVVNMPRRQGNSILGTAAQNIQACIPRERRVSGLALAGWPCSGVPKSPNRTKAFHFQ